MAKFTKGNRINDQISGRAFKVFLDKESRKIINKKVRTVKKVAPEEMKRTRRFITNLWFDTEGDGYAFEQSYEAKVVYTRFTGNANVKIYLSSWVNLDKLFSLSNHVDLDKWIDRHEKFSDQLDWEYTEKEWIFHLPWDEGVIGLPKYASTYEYLYGEKYDGPGWKNGRNLNFVKRSNSLKNATHKSNLWKEYFDNEIDKIIKNND